MTDASDGNAKDPAVQGTVLKRAGFDPKNLITCKQVHGDRVVEVESVKPQVHPDADGLITAKPGLVLGIFAADCMPVFLSDPEHRALGLVHSGWRGTKRKVAVRAVEAMVRRWKSDPLKLEARLGPHIRDCCYKVGPEVTGEFAPECSRLAADGAVLSLEIAMRRQLEQAGLKTKNIIGGAPCTCCCERFFSYRRDRTENRLLAYAGIIATQR